MKNPIFLPDARRRVCGRIFDKSPEASNTTPFRLLPLAGLTLVMMTIAMCSDPVTLLNSAKANDIVTALEEVQFFELTDETLSRTELNDDDELVLVAALYNADGEPINMVEYYRRAAEQGDASAQFNLGQMYFSGDGVPKDFPKGAVWFRKAAEQGHVTAQYILGVLYNAGSGVPKDVTKAAAWYRMAAEQGHADAQFFLGGLYDAGSGVSEDATKAFLWYRKAAEQGHADAQKELGRMYHNGEGVPRDATKAVEWSRKAAEQGLATAQYNLGWTYRKGEGVPKDAAKAAGWFRKAAEQGYGRAQGILGMMHIYAEGVPKDPVLAYAWLNLAASNPSLDLEGQKLAAQVRDTGVVPAMSPAQIAEAQRLSSNWKLGESLERELPSRKGPLVITNSELDDVNREPTKQLTGTAFFVSAAGHAITNNHVVQGCKAVTAEGKGKVFQVLTADAANDLALLQSPERRSETARLPAQPSKLRQGQEVVVFGFPLNAVLSSGGNLTPGAVSALTGAGNNTSQIQITAPIQPGSSGSPVLDRQGHVVGVVAMKLSDNAMANAMGTLAQNVNFAVSGQTLTSFLEAHQVPYEHGRSWFVRDKPLADLADEARKWTVVVECWK